MQKRVLKTVQAPERPAISPARSGRRRQQRGVYVCQNNQFSSPASSPGHNEKCGFAPVNRTHIRPVSLSKSILALIEDHECNRPGLTDKPVAETRSSLPNRIGCSDRRVFRFRFSIGSIQGYSLQAATRQAKACTPTPKSGTDTPLGPYQRRCLSRTASVRTA